MNTTIQTFPTRQIHAVQSAMNTTFLSARKPAATLLTLAAMWLLPASVHAQTASISGTVNYSGRQTGDVWVLAATKSTMPTNLDGSFSVKAAVSTALGAFTNISFTLTNLPTGTNYWLFAWRDSNTNSLNDTTEARATSSAACAISLIPQSPS